MHGIEESVHNPSADPRRDDDSLVLVYDGVCALCNGLVRFLLRHDRGRLLYASMQGDFGRAVRERHPEFEAVDSVLLVEISKGTRQESVTAGPEALLRLASRLGGILLLFGLTLMLPAHVRQLLYDALARRRYRMFGRYAQCPLPPENFRKRFLE